MDIPWERGLRLVIAPFLIISLIAWGRILEAPKTDQNSDSQKETTENSNVNRDDEGGNGKSIEFKSLELLAGAVVLSVVLGFAVSGLSLVLLRIPRIFCCEWARSLDYEIPFSNARINSLETDIMELNPIGKQRRCCCVKDASKNYAERLVLVIAFQRLYLHEGILKWMDRRWTTFGTNINGFVGLVLGYVLGMYLFESVRSDCCWHVVIIVVGTCMFINAMLAWYELRVSNEACMDYVMQRNDSLSRPLAHNNRDGG